MAYANTNGAKLYRVDYVAPIGTIQLGAEDDGLVYATMHTNIQAANDRHPVLDTAMKALDRYFEKQAPLDGVPLLIRSAPFTASVYQAMRQIPFGKVMRYQDLAKQAGNERAARAAGNACARNQLLLFVPCHRVVSDTSLGGFSAGLDVKRWLLKHEGVMPSDDAI